VLSIAKLRVGAEAYQLTGVAQSLGDYYSGAGEAAGWWAGRGAEHLGLDGEVGGDDLRAVLAGIRPGTGGLSPNREPIRPHARRVPGFDLTFKAPKSVSVLYGISDDPRVQGAIIEAAEVALRDTLAWVERDVMAVRRGSDDQRYLANLAAKDPAAADAKRLRTERGADMVAAVFRHRTSRSGDPLLHWHVLVPNLVRGSDERWSAFVHPDLYRLQKAAGEVFQTALRHQLTESLGVGWRPGRHVPEIDGVPAAVLDAFSKRSAEINAWLETHGRGQDPRSRQEAVLETRRGKAELEGERLDTAWKIEGTHLGFGPEHAEALISALQPGKAATEVWKLPEVSTSPDGTPYTHDRTVTPEVWIADLLAHDLITRDATFTSADLYQAVAHRLGDGATVTTIDRIAARVLVSDQVIPVASRNHRDTTRRWTSAAMVATERRLLDAFDQRGTRAAVPSGIAEAVAARHPALGADQMAAMHTLAACVNPVSVLIGPAGTGKTYTLAVVREALELAGLKPIGAAPSARAAVELESGAGIESHTLHALGRQWARPGEGPDATTVLVIDEAAMASTCDLEALVTRTLDAGGRIVLVGDHHQLPEIGPGGALAAAVQHVGAVAELTVNRRQIEPWERDALDELRSGSVPAAVAAYRDHGRVQVAEDPQTMLTIAVNRYLEALGEGRRPVLMAGTNDTVNRLNAAVRIRLAEHAALDLGAVIATSGGRELVVGDRIVLRRNAWIPQPDGGDARIRNSDAATVVGVAANGGIVVRRDTDAAQITLDSDYLGDGWVDHGYAVTAHRAQGGTWDHAIAVGVDGLYREAAYVQLSRGRHTNWLIIPRTQMAEIDREIARHGTGLPLPGEEPPETVEDLIGRINRSRAKLMALTRDPDADRVAELAQSSTVSGLEARARRCRAAEGSATESIGIEPDVMIRAVERAQRTALHVAIGQQIKAFDRNNIGTVVGLDDNAGTVEVCFTSTAGRSVTRTLPWTELHIVERRLPSPRVLPPTAQRHLDHLVDACARTLDDWHQHLAEHQVTAGEAIRCERAAQLLVGRGAERLTTDQPGWLTDMLGPRPVTAQQSRLWDSAVHAVAQHRLRHGIPADTPGIGSVPTLDSEARREWFSVSRQLATTQLQLDHTATTPPEPWPLLRTLAELRTRENDLTTILSTAPEDQRDLIARLQNAEQPALLDIAQELTDALQTQGNRRDWILEHWPHVVEYTEVRAAITSGHHAPDLPALRDRLSAESRSTALGRALDGQDPWLDRTLCRLVEPHATEVSGPVRQLLERLADYRAAWAIEDPTPLGPAPRHPAQAAALDALLDDVADLAGPVDPPATDDLPLQLHTPLAETFVGAIDQPTASTFELEL
jgi:conjugative relaxase-like TrwC/TraI family protein